MHNWANEPVEFDHSGFRSSVVGSVASVGPAPPVCPPPEFDCSSSSDEVPLFMDFNEPVSKSSHAFVSHQSQSGTGTAPMHAATRILDSKCYPSGAIGGHRGRPVSLGPATRPVQSRLD